MELEGSQNRVGRETEWRWKRDGIAVEGSWELVGQWMGLTGDEKALACRIIRGRAVVVGVRENAEFPPKMSKKCILNAKVYILIPM